MAYGLWLMAYGLQFIITIYVECTMAKDMPGMKIRIGTKIKAGVKTKIVTETKTKYGAR